MSISPTSLACVLANTDNNKANSYQAYSPDNGGNESDIDIQFFNSPTWRGTMNYYFEKFT